MITASAILGLIGEEIELGDHQFVCLPRIAESFLTNIGGNIASVIVTDVYHHPRRQGGPDRDPVIVLRVKNEQIL